MLVALLLASMVTSQDPQKRNSLLSKRAGNRNIFQKSTTTTTEANYEVSVFNYRFTSLLIKSYLRKKNTLTSSCLRTSNKKTTSQAPPRQPPQNLPRKFAQAFAHSARTKTCCPPWRNVAWTRRTTNRLVSWLTCELGFVSDNFHFAVDLNLAQTTLGNEMQWIESNFSAASSAWIPNYWCCTMHGWWTVGDKPVQSMM